MLSQDCWRYEIPGVKRQVEPPWIPCATKMPPVGELVCVWREGLPRGTAAYLRSDGEFGFGSAVWKFITHWMPMPQPPAS